MSQDDPQDVIPIGDAEWRAVENIVRKRTPLLADAIEGGQAILEEFFHGPAEADAALELALEKANPILLIGMGMILSMAMNDNLAGVDKVEFILRKVAEIHLRQQG